MLALRDRCCLRSKLSDDSDGDVDILRSESKVQASMSPEVVCKETTPPVSPPRSPGQSKVVTKPVVSIIHSLMCLGACKWSKSVLSQIKFDAIKL